MKTHFLLILLLLSAIQTTANAGNPPGEAEANINPAFLHNPREEFRIGVGTSIGGMAGGIGIQGDIHLLPRFGVQVGVGSALYMESVYFSVRHYFWESKASPYVATGYASWRTHNPQKLDDNLPHFTKLGLTGDSSVHILPLIAGLQFLSENGLAAFIEFEYLFSITSAQGIPYGGLGFQWYF